MGQLLEVYRPAIRAHLIRRKGVRRDNVEDLIQDFYLSQVIERDLIARAEKERGRFRSLLLTALDHHVVDTIRHDLAIKRNPAGQTVDVSTVDPADTATPPDTGFEVEWARSVVRQTVDRMFQACQNAQKKDVWTVFDARLYRPIFAGEKTESYAEIVRRHGLESPDQASNRLITAKRMFERCLRSVLGEYAIHDEQEVDEEIHDLMRVLARSKPISEEPSRREYAGGDELVKPSRLDDSSAGDLARLIAMGTDSIPRWQPQDLADIFEHQLTTPLAYDVGTLADTNPEQLRHLMESAQPPIRTFRDLLTHAQPPLKLLELVKEAAKTRRDDPANPVPPSIASAVYYACLAMARVRRGTSLTSMKDDDYGQGLRWALAQDWISDSIRVVFQNASIQLADPDTTISPT